MRRLLVTFCRRNRHDRILWESESLQNRIGEYATQIGFGWTNGVLVALTSLYPDLKAEAKAAVPGRETATITALAN